MSSFRITYEEPGGRIDHVIFHAKTLAQAIKDFCQWPQDVQGFVYTMNEHSIIKIERTHSW